MALESMAKQVLSYIVINIIVHCPFRPHPLSINTANGTSYKMEGLPAVGTNHPAATAPA